MAVALWWRTLTKGERIAIGMTVVLGMPIARRQPERLEGHPARVGETLA